MAAFKSALRALAVTDPVDVGAVVLSGRAVRGLQWERLEVRFRKTQEGGDSSRLS